MPVIAQSLDAFPGTYWYVSVGLIALGIILAVGYVWAKLAARAHRRNYHIEDIEVPDQVGKRRQR